MQKVSQLNTEANFRTEPVKYGSDIQSRWVICMHRLKLPTLQVERENTNYSHLAEQLPNKVC